MQTQPAVSGPSRAWETALVLLGVSALVAVLSVTAADPDLWGHLRFGLDILQDGEIAETDPYSYLTAGQRWINHEWLAEVLFALAWSLAGDPGLIVLKTAVGLATVGLLYRHLLTTGLHPVRAAIAFVLLGLPLLIPYLFFARPQIFTFLLFAATLLVVRRADRGEYRWLWAAPPLLALWVNLHGGVLAGAGILGCWAGIHLAFHWQARWKVLRPALVSALALLANPYGPDLLVFLLTTATVPRPEIVEWQPLDLRSVGGLLYVVVLVPAACGVIFGKRPRERATLLALFTLTAILPLLSVRHLPLFSMAAIVFAGDNFAEAWLRMVGRDARPAPRPASPWAATWPVAAAVALLALAYQRNYLTRVHMTPGFDCPEAAVELLKRSGVAANLLPEFGWGEYILWHLGPRIQVGMDGRRETIYPPDVYEQYLDFGLGIREWDAVLKRQFTDIVLIERGETAYNLMKLNTGWILVYEDSLSAMFVNRASPVLEPLRQAAATFSAPPPKPFFP